MKCDMEILWSYESRADKGRKKRQGKDHVGARQRKKHRATAAEKPRSEGAPAHESVNAFTVFEHDVSDQVLSDNAAAQILNQMTRNVDDNNGVSADPTDQITHATQDIRRLDRLIVNPMGTRVHSDSATFQTQNAEESNSTSAFLGARSTGLDGAFFVYQNDSIIVNDESSSIQQTHARNRHHDQNIITTEEGNNGHQNQAYASNSPDIFAGESISFDTDQAMDAGTNSNWQTDTTGVSFDMGQAIDDEANFHWQTNIDCVSFNMNEAINSSYSIHHEPTEQGTLPLSGTTLHTLEDIIADANARIDSLHSIVST